MIRILPRRRPGVVFHLVAALAALSLPTSLHAATLVRDGKPVAKIYVTAEVAGTADDAAANSAAPAKRGGLKAAPLSTDAQRLAEARDLLAAVNDFNDHLQKMAGTKLEIVAIDAKGVTEIAGPALILGDLAVPEGGGGATPTKTSLSLEGFRIIVKGDRILVGGQSNTAVAFGLYQLLRKLGCDWVMPGEIGQIVPRKTTVELPDLDEAQAPDFLLRRLWYRGYHTKDHPAKPAEGQNFALWLRRQKAGNFNLVAGQTAGHVWDQFMNRHRAEFEKDPTMYALRLDGNGELKRLGPQLESTHPRVVQIFVEEIKNAYKTNIEAGKWTADTAAGFGIGPADGLGYSRSEASRKASPGRLDPIVGEEDQTDLLVLLGNEILAQVHKEYPNAMVGFYSYSVHADYPARYTPDPKMAVIFAPINFSRYHSVLDPNSRSQAWYRQVVEKWGDLSRKQGNPLLYRGYNWNLAENLVPYTKVRIWGEELPFYKKQGILGLNVEATKMWSILGASDYVFMRLAWNSRLDWKAVLKEYCEKAYGKAGPAMEQYNLALAQRQSDAKQEAGSYHAIHLIYTPGVVAQLQRSLDEAARAADTADDKTRVAYVAAGLETLKLYLAYHSATMNYQFVQAQTALEKVKAKWDESYNLNSELVANEAPQYIKRFLQGFVDQAVQYSSEPNQIVQRIPDSLPTFFDADQMGETAHFEATNLKGIKFTPTQTYTTTWDAQGFADRRRGAVWYRHPFSLPADVKGKPIGLFVGGVEDEVRVWINGKAVGTSGVHFSSPAVFDLTDGLKTEGINLLVMEVIRNSNANEIGLGGILRPCFLFTGPRLEKKAPTTMPSLRVLPGGELGKPE
ncbi:MAG: DUF4838 domain-containing protein [Planctomycetota bacterium]|nr:DUF4838 domain-containing protein [Planctomycetota bacterium]